MGRHRMAVAIMYVACGALIGCVDRFATRELLVIEPLSNRANAFPVDYSAVPERYIRKVEGFGEQGQPITVLYLQTRVKVTVVPVNDLEERR